MNNESNVVKITKERDPTKAALAKKTVGEIGPNLLLGFPGADGKSGKSIVCRPWRMAEERILGHRRKDNEDRNMGKYVSIVLAGMCQRLGPASWPSMEGNDILERELVVSQMWVPDVFYAYVWLRIQAMGEELHMKLKCPTCAMDFDWTGDLRTLEVGVPETIEHARFQYTLRDGVDLRGKKITKFVLGPQRWFHIENMGDTTQGAAKGTVITASIHFVPELSETDEIVLEETELDGLTKYDLERLCRVIDEESSGPVLKVEPSCPRKHSFVVPIDWRYDNFFGSSSASPN